jgi:hypothetical protein
MSTENHKFPGCPSISKNEESAEQVRNLVRKNRRLTIHEMANEAGISYDSCQDT